MWPRPTTKRDRPTSASALMGGKPDRPPGGNKCKANGERGQGQRESMSAPKSDRGRENKNQNMISRGATIIKKLKLTKFVSLHSKPIREDNKIFEGHVPSTIKCTPKVQQRNEENHTQKGAKMGGKGTVTGTAQRQTR